MKTYDLPHLRLSVFRHPVFLLVLVALPLLGATFPAFAQCDPDGDNSDQDIECTGNDANGLDAEGGDDNVEVDLGATVQDDITGGAGNDTITNNGEVGADVYGGDDDDIITNNNFTGSIYGDDFASGSSGNDVIVNNGYVDGEIDGGAGQDTIANDGTVGDVFGGSGNDTLTNTGSVYGEIDGDSGSDTIINDGLVQFDLDGDGGNDLITNNGLVGDDIDGDGGNDVITNSGEVGGDVFADEGNDVITNTETGVIEGGIESGDGNDLIENSGVVFLDIFGEDGEDEISNDGTVLGEIQGNDGSDTITNEGTVVGDVEGNLGDDTIINIGTVIDDILGQEGDDIIENSGSVQDILAGSGNDSIEIGNGAVVSGVINGGSGFDSLIFAFTGVSPADAAFIQSVINAANNNPGNPGSLTYLGQTYAWQSIEEIVNMIRIIARRSNGQAGVEPSSNTGSSNAQQDQGIINPAAPQAATVTAVAGLSSQPLLFCQDNAVTLFRQPSGAVDIFSRVGNFLVASIPAGSLTSGLTFQSVGGGNPGFFVQVGQLGTNAFQIFVANQAGQVVSNGCTFIQTSGGPLIFPQGSSTIPLRGLYRVRDGDNLFRIALRFGTSIDRLTALNNIANSNLIFPGQVLRIG